MKNTLLFFISIMFLPLAINSQVDRSQFKFQDSIKSLLVQQALNDLKINLYPEDSLGLDDLELILQRIDTILYNIKPQSKYFGHDIFHNNNTAVYNRNSVIKLPDSYILGPGDEIAVSIFGVSQYEAKLELDSEGFVQPSDLPKIYLKGISWGNAKQILKRRLSRYYTFRPDQMTITLAKPRTMTVNIFGEVNRSGSYDLLATNTALQALVAAGGPTAMGSVREIIITNGEETKILDIYKLIFDPINQFQFYLDDNTIIQVPTTKKIVEIEGAVNRPMYYELLENERINDLINYAGGLNADAVKRFIQIERYVNDEKILIDVENAFQSSIDDSFALIHGDKVIIKRVEAPIKDFVQVSGEVELPGVYALESTKRVSQLLSKARLKKESRLDLAFIRRANRDGTFKLIQLDLNQVLSQTNSNVDLVLEPQDVLIINSKRSYVDQYNISVKGAVRREITYPFDPDSTITLHQALLLAGGVRPDASDVGYLIRTNLDNLVEKEYLSVNFKEALRNPGSPSNLVLKPLDEIQILTDSLSTNLYEVSISGAIKSPGTFQFDASLQIKDLLIICGGLRPEASNKIDVYRIDMGGDRVNKPSVISLEINDDLSLVNNPADFQLKPFDRIVVRSKAEFELQQMVLLTGEVVFPGEYALIKENERVSDVIRRAGGITEEAFMDGFVVNRRASEKGDSLEVINVAGWLSKALNNYSSDFNIILRGGDEIKILKDENLVYIDLNNTALQPDPRDSLASKLYQIGVPYHEGKNARWYINEFAGGFASGTSKSKIIVNFLNGSSKGVKRFGPFLKFPKPTKGSLISILDTTDKTQKAAGVEFEPNRPRPN
jgi:protein involved in polysaccharide export with SLBB domain